MQSKEDARCKEGKMRNERQGKCVMHSNADARGNAGQMPEASPGRCANQVPADERIMSGQTRESRLGSGAWLGRAAALGKACLSRDAGSGRCAR
jgi:hypothetical protein